MDWTNQKQESDRAESLEINQDLIIPCLQKVIWKHRHLNSDRSQDLSKLKVKAWKCIFHTNGSQGRCEAMALI